MEVAAANDGWKVEIAEGRVVDGVDEDAGGFGFGKDCAVDGGDVGGGDDEKLAGEVAGGVVAKVEGELAGGGEVRDAGAGVGRDDGEARGGGEQRFDFGFGEIACADHGAGATGEFEEDGEKGHINTLVIYASYMASQTSRFEDIPRRIFLDSSTLQNLQSYGGFLYENEPLVENARILRDSNGLVKLEALRNIMAIAERAPFQFALSANSFNEVQRKDDGQYLQWAFDVLDHWLACLAESEEQPDRSEVANIFDSLSYNYLGAG